MAPKWVWATAWRSSKRLLPALHRWDPVAPSDTCVNLMVVWLKALSGNRLDGMADGGISYAFLPPITRWLVGPLVAWLYPRLHHQNIAMRSSFLERAVEAELQAANGGAAALVALGAGFDGRSLRYATSEMACVELGARVPTRFAGARLTARWLASCRNTAPTWRFCSRPAQICRRSLSRSAVS